HTNLKTDMKTNKLLFFFLLLIAAGDCAAKESVADSLSREAAPANPDSVRIKALLQLSSLYEDSIPAQAISYLEEGLGIARRAGNKKQLTEVSNQLGTLYYYAGD